MSDIIEFPVSPIIDTVWLQNLSELRVLMRETFGERAMLRKLDTVINCITILNLMEEDLSEMLYAASRFTKRDAGLDELCDAVAKFGRCGEREPKTSERIFYAAFDYYPENFPAMCVTEPGNAMPVLLVGEDAVHALEVCIDANSGLKNIGYVCNGKACAPKLCNPECSHTLDVFFARNFEKLKIGNNTVFWERDNREDMDDERKTDGFD